VPPEPHSHVGGVYEDRAILAPESSVAGHRRDWDAPGVEQVSCLRRWRPCGWANEIAAGV